MTLQRTGFTKRPTRCKAPGCTNRFVKRSMTHKVCSPECSEAFVELEKAKKLRLEIRVERARRKKRPERIKEAQWAFNRYIRLRDVGLPCICCGRHGLYASDNVGGGDFDAGHYRSVGSAPHLRFNEDNVHAQLKRCNQYGAGRAVDYRIGLVQRIGIERVEALESNQSPLNLDNDQLIELRNYYRAKARELEKMLSR